MQSCKTNRALASTVATLGDVSPAKRHSVGFESTCPCCQERARARVAFSKNPSKGAVARPETAVEVVKVA